MTLRESLQNEAERRPNGAAVKRGGLSWDRHGLTTPNSGHRRVTYNRDTTIS